MAETRVAQELIDPDITRDSELDARVAPPVIDTVEPTLNEGEAVIWHDSGGGVNYLVARVNGVQTKVALA